MLKRLLVLIFGILVLCGCSSKNNAEIITFSSWGSVTEVGIIKKIISDFEKENPGIKIKFLHVPQNYFQKLHLLFASNTPPDVIFINNLYLPVYANKLADLSNFVNKDEFYEQSLSALSYEGKLLAIPRDISNLVLYVNLDLLTKISQNLTMTEFLALAKEVSKNGIYGIGMEDEAYYLLPYLSYFGEDFETILSSEHSKGLEFYKDLKNKEKAAPKKSQVGSSTLAQMFLDKKIAMYLSGRWMYPKITEKADFKWQIISFPKGEFLLPCDSSGWSISKDSKHKESAIRFVQYLSDKKSSEYFTDTGLIVPARKSVSERLNNKKHNEQVFLTVINNSKNTKVTKDYKKKIDKINRLLQE